MPSPRAERITVAQSSVNSGDPHICSDSSNRLSIIFSVYEALVKRDERGRFAPSLAESWSVEDGARTWTFNLRQGVRFHNGDILRAQARARALIASRLPMDCSLASKDHN